MVNPSRGPQRLARNQQQQAAAQVQRQRVSRCEKALQSLGRHQSPSCEPNLLRCGKPAEPAAS